jgi:hypothetical protein
MGNSKQNYRQEYDDEERSNKRKKHPKHSPNVRGQGMRTLNSYVEEEDFTDKIFEKETQDNTNIRFYTKH